MAIHDRDIGKDIGDLMDGGYDMGTGVSGGVVRRTCADHEFEIIYRCRKCGVSKEFPIIVTKELRESLANAKREK